jgi:hypothetical protein
MTRVLLAHVIVLLLVPDVSTAQPRRSRSTHALRVETYKSTGD